MVNDNLLPICIFSRDSTRDARPLSRTIRANSKHVWICILWLLEFYKLHEPKQQLGLSQLRCCGCHVIGIGDADRDDHN